MSDEFPAFPKQMALLIVDMERYFTEPDHPFARLSSTRVEGGIASYFERIETVVIPNIQSLLWVFREKAYPIIYTQLGSHSLEGSDLPSWARRLNDSGRAAFGCAVFPSFHDASAEIDPRVTPQPGDRVLRKTTTGATASTSLESELRARGVTAVVVTGVLTPYCVTQTARELADRNFDVAIIENASASMTPAAHHAALGTFAAVYGWVLSLDEMIAAMREP